MRTSKEQKEIQAVEFAIGKILRIGVIVSAAIIFFGLVLLLAKGGTGYKINETPNTLTLILTGLWALKPGAYIMAGIFCLILTPVLRVVVSIYAFLKEKDYLYVTITIIVLIILLIGIFTGFVERK
ncbi:DUF1634 domain-containing protein [Enterococcus sp. SMC-9]|uniref:DUF1634 domain-containing protein n=1 Tax=Enterococcus sp. SMC-9 TaxID=2862343 RepID=UPI001E5BFC0C|nr:DUF1634 domain-containing protein [Enterococcus sp. SMC-9]MCD1024228.1 DUF1634 domain-containing protein [Enterococcus sp. SMC-9]